ncbi:MAG: 16S rRNA (guanine(527)-N(7))-methyltransferase RsmG [Candidatus Thiodiazotropha sp.]
MVDEIYDRVACRLRLVAGATEMGLHLDTRQQALMVEFLALLVKWNSAYNLTAVREPLEMVGRHLLDSLALLPHLKTGPCLDMGTGAGVPGIPLAIMRPDSDFVLLDSNSKKIRFVRQAKLELGLVNVQPVHARVEQYQADRPFKTLIARAFTALPNMFALSAGLHQPGVEILAMKGSIPEQEIAQLPAHVMTDVIPLRVPFEAGERCLVRIGQIAGFHAK